MEELWQRLCAALAHLSPTLPTRLRPGVDEALLRLAEQQLGMPLPEDVKAYFRLQNGSQGPLFGTWEMLSLEEVCAKWLQLKALSQNNDVFSYNWQESWFPFLRSAPWWLPVSDDTSLYLFLDLSLPYPGFPLPKKPSSGEAIRNELLARLTGGFVQRSPRIFRHALLDDAPVSEQSYVASSMQELLEEIIQALEQGVYVYAPKAQVLRKIGTSLALLSAYEPSPLELDEDLPGVDWVWGKRVAYPGLCCISYERASAQQSVAMLQQSVAHSWQQIREHLVPEIGSFLRSGATSSLLQHVEEGLGVQLPEEVKAWYLLCNGTSVDTKGMFTHYLFDFWIWYDLESILWRWELLQDEHMVHTPRPFTGTYQLCADERIQQITWHPHWIPFMDHEDGSLLCIDLAPSPQGQRGQIILLHYKSMIYHDLDIRKMPPLLWIAPNLRLFLAALAHDFVLGKYTFDPKMRMLWSQEGWAYMNEDENLRERLVARQELLLDRPH